MAAMAAPARRVVLFGLDGVLLQPSLQQILSSCEREWALPRGFLQDVLLQGGTQSPFSRALRGLIPLTQLIEELCEGCRLCAAALGTALPDAFSASRPFRDLQEQGRVNERMLRAAQTLRDNGFLTCVVANSWLDNGPGRAVTAALLTRLRRRFHLVLESCRAGSAKPDPGIVLTALETLQARPQQAVLVDSVVENLLPARGLGLGTVLVTNDPDAALGELERICGIKLLGPEGPVPSSPDDVAHGHVHIRAGVQVHFAELGQGPALCLCHGFPETWRSWRFQIPALAEGGFRVIVPEMKGYGESWAPPDISEYSQEQICKDFVTFLDKLGLAQVVLVGHDWGGALVWNLALFYPERVRAVCSLNTPYRPADPNIDIVEKIKSIPAFDYQLYFQEPGVAEAELEKDIERTLKILIRSQSPEDRLPVSPDFRRVRERGGLLVGFPEEVPESRLLPPKELQLYTQQFRKSGFRGPLNWYRNMRENWEWALSARHRKISVPALLVTAGKDPVLHPNLSHGMETWIPRLQRRHLELCGHWTQLERPLEVNQILLEWLENLPPENQIPNSKL